MDDKKAEATGPSVIVLAAGQGTRMKSDKPKVLHQVAGRPLVAWPIEAALAAGASKVVVVVGHGRAQVEAYLGAAFDDRVVTAVQEEQLGTGHAAGCALPALAEHEGDVIILMGDVPLIEKEALEALISARHLEGAPLSMLTSTLDDPKGYGRIVRDSENRISGIREHRDCSDVERDLKEINPGVYAADLAFLRRALSELKSDNAAGELYLTDVAQAAAEQGEIRSVDWPLSSLLGINDRVQLAQAGKIMARRLAESHARNGVTFTDLDSVYIDSTVTIGKDASIAPNVHLRGMTSVGEGAVIDAGCVVQDSQIASGAYLKPYSVLSDSSVGEDAQVGPFAHLRPGTELGPESKVGNFVEVKKTVMGRGSKASHLSYLGDGLVGEGVNIGAGTIFCNYDGVQKHQTVLEDGAFIGSDSQLVAPVTVGKGAFVATGTTVTKNVPADALALGRIKQVNKEGYASRLRGRFAAAKAAKLKKAAEAKQAAEDQ